MKCLHISSTTAILTFLHLFLTLQAQNLVMTPEARGTDVVLATVSLIQGSGIFPDDNRLLRRVAFVESRDGLDGDTFRDGYNGGIWQVDEEIFRVTTDTVTHPFLLEDGGIYQQLSVTSTLRVDWTAVTWENLRIPLISGIAARIFFEIQERLGEPIPGIGDVQGQGEYWKGTGFNDNEVDTAEFFVLSVTLLELEECPNRGIDIAFVLDSSGSVGERNFDLELQLVRDIVNRFEIGPNATQVAVVSYSGFARVNFRFNDFTNRADVQQAVTEVEYFDIEVVTGPIRTSTNTADALIRLREEVFVTEGGARAADMAIPRVAVVMTDGRSNINRSLTIPSALALREEGVTVYAIGVGGKLDLEELSAIASSPENLVLVDDFDVTEFEGLRSRITADACVASVPIALAQTISIELDQGDFSYFEYEIPDEGITLTLRREEGTATLYASTKIRNPNSALYDLIIKGEGQEFVKPLVEDRGVGERKRRELLISPAVIANRTLYVSVEGVGEQVNRFEIEASLGNTVSFGFRCQATLSFILLFLLASLLLNS